MAQGNEYADDLPSGGFDRAGRGGAGRRSVLGFAVPSARRSGLMELPVVAPQPQQQRGRSVQAHQGPPSRCLAQPVEQTSGVP